MTPAVPTLCVPCHCVSRALENRGDTWLIGLDWCPALSLAEVGVWGPRHKANKDVFLGELLEPIGVTSAYRKSNLRTTDIGRGWGR